MNKPIEDIIEENIACSPERAVSLILFIGVISRQACHSLTRNYQEKAQLIQNHLNNCSKCSNCYKYLKKVFASDTQYRESFTPLNFRILRENEEYIKQLL